jgi:hypothetical protein
MPKNMFFNIKIIAGKNNCSIFAAVLIDIRLLYNYENNIEQREYA